MKINLFIIALLVTTSNLVAQNKVNWLTINEALALQKKEPKKIIMDVYTNWCGPCKMLDKNTFQNKDVAKYINKHYYAVKFNGEGNTVVKYKEYTFSNKFFDPAKTNKRNSPHQFASYLSVRAYPTLVFFDEKGDFIAPISGYKSPQILELYLKVFKTNDYKKLDTNEKFKAYSDNFKPQFVE